MSEKKTMKTGQGICPMCGSLQLDYGSLEVDDQSVGYPYTCKNCKFEGIEWYNLLFTTHTDSKGNAY